MQKNLGNNYNTNSGPSNTKLFEDAAKKLQKIEMDRKNAEKYFKEREMAENKLKLLESNLKKKVKLEKRAYQGLEEKTIEKVENLLKSLSNVDLNIINKIEVSQKTSKEVQTDNEDTQNLKDKLSLLEKENEKNLTKKKEYKKQIELHKSEIDNLKAFNEKISKENKLLQNNLQEITAIKVEYENRLKDYQMKIDNLNETLEKSKKSLFDYEELKKIMEEKLMDEKENLELEEQRKESLIKKGNLNILINYDLIDQVTKYLTPSDILNLKKTNRTTYLSIEKNINCMNHFYTNLINSYKKKIHELSSLDIKKEYIVNDMEIERLIKDYVKSNKQAGRELKSSIIKALGFMNRDVKTSLGIKVSNLSSTPKSMNSTNSTGTANSSILGGIGSLFGGMFHAQKGPQQMQNSPMPINKSLINTPKGDQSVQIHSKASSRGMSIALSNEMPIEIEKYDKFLIHESLTNPNDFYDFEYSSVEDIRNLLNKFLKSNFSTEKLTAFIKEVCQEYSELLYFSNKSIIEIRELETVKNALNERYRRYHKLSQQLEADLTDMKKSLVNSLQEDSNKVDMKEKQNLEIKYQAAMNEVCMLRAQSETSSKKAEMIKFREEQISSEYETFKTIFIKEIRNLKLDLEETTRQRDNLRDVLIEFKGYFNNLNNMYIPNINK